jgi:4-hydroxyacetophenone monooxygenase
MTDTEVRASSPSGPDTALDDRQLRRAVAEANVPVLALVAFHLTGERGWLDGRFRPRRSAGLDDNATGGLPPVRQELIRHAAFDAIRRWRNGEAPAMEQPEPDRLVEMLSLSMGEEVGPEYGPMIAAELGFEEDRGDDFRFPPGFEVLVVGAGLSGLVVAKRLTDAGARCRILERADDVGGTWRDNRYPGCGVDTPSAIYSFSFAAHPWSRYFAERDEVQAYLRKVADEEGLTGLIEFGRNVVRTEYDERSRRWHVTARCPDGSTREYSPNVVVSAVGVFSEPKWPQIDGLAGFPGDVVHTAEWDDSIELHDQRVGVIGNGASAMQLVPAVVDRVRRLTVFQRSAQWVAPFPQFQAEVPEPVRELSQNVPLYRRWYRVRAGWTFNDRLHSALQRDPEWEHPERSVSARNDEHRKYFTAYLNRKLAGRDDLRKALLPTYPPFGKRILLDNGWYDAVSREHVGVETSRITHFEGSEAVTADGRRHPLDVLVCATGFQAVRILSTLDVVGRGGRDLHEFWGKDDARAYLGCVVPGFPNFFIMYGPNVQAGHGGSLIGLAEMQSDYIVDVLRQTVRGGGSSVEVRHDVWQTYNDEIDRAHDAMIWTHPGMSTYYRNSQGRVVVPGPFRVIDLWHRTRRASLDDSVLDTGTHRTERSV